MKEEYSENKKVKIKKTIYWLILCCQLTEPECSHVFGQILCGCFFKHFFE